MPGRRARPSRSSTPKFTRAVYALVRRVPRGRVVTYGQVAAILGHPRAARAVGTALSNLPNNLARVVPWQRVINASGGISSRGDILRADLQRELLEVEGVAFRRSHVDLTRFRWQGPRRERRVELRVELPLEAGKAGRRARRAKSKTRGS